MAAVGMWQFVAFRGKEYGLNQTTLADERMDPEKATRAAARHLRDLYDHFGDWYLAIAAYNCGPVAVDRAIERTGYADFWELRRLGVLPAETTNYVPIILAMTIMSKNAAEYGLDHVVPEAPVEYDTVEMAAPTQLALVSDLTEMPVAQLMELNPALLKTVAPEGYSLHVPKGTAAAFAASLDAVPPDRRKAWRVHKVGYGETLASIGKRYNTAASSIASVNSLNAGAAVQEGDRLLIPAAYQEPRTTARKAVARSTTRRASTSHSKSSTATRTRVTAAKKKGTSSSAVVARNTAR
jgi:membrane-bound lytic murein transglycosylase D